MTNTNVQNYLIDSLKLSKNSFNNLCNASHPFPCGICQKNVHNNQKYIKCTSCKFKVHIKCNGTTVEEYNTINDSSPLHDEQIDEIDWLCNRCLISNMAEKFPFGLESNYDLINIMTTESLKSLKNLHTYVITSKANNTDFTNQYDIDDNIVNNINSRYYSANKFNNMNTANSTFNIIHSNLNGLENKFDDYHTFINNTKTNIDVLCISETTQKENCPFNLIINIEGYKQPFTLGSKTATRGVAIYVKNEYDVIERNDLNLVDNSFEAVWVEIRNEKAKNIVCGCIYKHPKVILMILINIYLNALLLLTKKIRNVMSPEISILIF